MIIYICSYLDKVKRCLVQVGNVFQYIFETISDPVEQVIQTDHKSGLRSKGKQIENIPACCASPRVCRQLFVGRRLV